MNVLTDTHDVTPGDGSALDSSGNTSLRAAIEEANAWASADTIQFDAGLFGGNLEADEIERIHRYLSQFDPEMVDQMMHH